MTLRHRPRSTRGTLSRLAIGVAASLAIVASTGVTAGAADDVAADDPDATSQAPTSSGDPAEAPPVGNPDEPTEEEPADTVTPVEEGTPEDPAATAPTAPASPASQGADAAEAPVVALAPNYGTQKVRVGVQLADGSWVPEGTVLTGSVLRVTITGGVDEDDVPLPDDSFECTTSGDFLDGDQTRSSTCDLGGSFGTRELGAGQTMTIEHLSSPVGIQVNPEPLVIGPCETSGLAGSPCPEDVIAVLAGGLVEVTGTLPTANPDAASTPAGTAIVIDVLANDDSGNGAPVTDLAIAEQPVNGTAEVIGEIPPVVEPEPEPDPELDPELELVDDPQAAGAPVTAAASSVQVRYTPNAGFVGTDTFVYAVSTPNGTAFATVTVQVLGAAAPTTPGFTSPTGTTAPIRRGTLPNVGGADATLVGLGALLVTAGAATLAAGRRREEVRGLA